jgi:serine/threonine protein kinase
MLTVRLELHGIADGLAYLHSLNMIHGDIKDVSRFARLYSVTNISIS